MDKITEKNNKKIGPTVRNLMILAALIVVFLTIVSYRTYVVYKEDLPSFEELHNIEPSLKTKIYSADGALLQSYFNENRVLTPYSQMPKHLINMLLAVEDQQFWEHWGINVVRIAKAAFVDLVEGRIAQGASTITQQLSRMLFLDREKTFARKIKEALTAIKLERTYSKEEILQMYLNQYYFGRGAHGIAAAARAYFDKRVDELSINDCALLVALLKGPSRFKVFDSTDLAIRIRNRSLYSYYGWGKISRAEYDSLRSLPLELKEPVQESGRAPYFTEMIRQYILDKYGEKVLYSGGLTVMTTLDWKLQQATEFQVKSKLDSLQARIERSYPVTSSAYAYVLPDTVDANGDSIRVYKQIQGAAIAINNENGDILSLVGGRSFAETKFNRAVQARLQPGSAFKPFIYTAAIDNGYHPSDIFYDNSIKLQIPGAKDWRPHNFDNEFLGRMTLRKGLEMSRNLIAIKLLLKITPEQAIFYAHKMGISDPLEPVASLAIGTGVVKPLDMVSAYTVFPNGGIHVPPRYILRITDRYGNVLEDNSNIQKEEVLSAQTAYIMVSMMQSVMDGEKGTGRGARWRGFTRPAGGKTGTSDNFCDNWFIGYTPQITAGVWVGFDEKTSIGKNQTGAVNALPIWVEIMKTAHENLPVLDFERPDGIEEAIVCLESGKLATDRCVEVVKEIFRTEDVPVVTCPIHPSKGLYVGPGSNPDKYIFPEDSTDLQRF
jgi:penicillin-binding protein 1A